MCEFIGQPTFLLGSGRDRCDRPGVSGVDPAEVANTICGHTNRTVATGPARDTVRRCCRGEWARRRCTGRVRRTGAAGPGPAVPRVGAACRAAARDVSRRPPGDGPGRCRGTGRCTARGAGTARRPPAGGRTRADRTAPRRPGSPGPKILPPRSGPAGPPRTSRPAPPAGRRRGRRRARPRAPRPTVGSPRPGQTGGRRRTTGVAGPAGRPAARRGGPDPPAPAPRDEPGQSSRAARRPPPAARCPAAPPRTAGPPAGGAGTTPPARHTGHRVPPQSRSDASGSFRPSDSIGVFPLVVQGFPLLMVYYLDMPSIVGKRQGNHTYYYLVESARVDGKARIVSQQYLGSAAEVMAKLSGSAAGEPVRAQYKSFGDLAAVWSMLERLDVAAIIDAVVPRYASAAASVGTYMALATANRIVAPCSKLAFADWWDTTAGPRWVKIRGGVVDHRRFWDAMDCIASDFVRKTIFEIPSHRA